MFSEYYMDRPHLKVNAQNDCHKEIICQKWISQMIFKKYTLKLEKPTFQPIIFVKVSHLCPFKRYGIIFQTFYLKR